MCFCVVQGLLLSPACSEVALNLTFANVVCAAHSPCTVIIDELVDCNLDRATDQVSIPRNVDPNTRVETSLAQYPSIAFIDLEPDDDPYDKKWEACGLTLYRDNLRHFIVRLFFLYTPFIVINVPIDMAADCVQVVAATKNWVRVSRNVCSD